MKISLENAQKRLLDGDIIGVPTETVYGLGASLLFPQAIEKIFSLKGRPANNPLIIHVASIDQILEFTSQDLTSIYSLANHFWPGPMTLVLPINAYKVPEKVRAGLQTAAFRIPSHPKTLELLKVTGPLVMPSANLSGKPSATLPEHVEEDFGEDFPVLDGGKCDKGLESTILLLVGEKWTIIRQGALSAENFASVLGYFPEIVNHQGKNPLCPGQMYRHYAPKAKLNLSLKIPPEYKGAILGFSDKSYPSSCQLISLGSISNPEQVAENLYAALRKLDTLHLDEVLVDIDFPYEGLFMTISERLQKAAAK